MGIKKNRTKELEAELKDVQEKLNDAERQRAQEKALLQAAVETEKRANETILVRTAQLEQELKDIQEKVAQRIKERDEHAAQVAQLSKENAQLESRYEQSRSAHETASQALSKEQRICSEHEQEIKQLKQSTREMKDKLDRLENVGGRYTDELKAAINRANELELKLAQEQKNRQETTNSLQNELVKMENNAKEKQNSFYELKRRVEKEKGEAEQKLKAAELKINQMNEELVLLSMCGEAKDPKNVLKERVMDLQKQIFNMSDELVKQGEKNVKLAEKMGKIRDAYEFAKHDIKKARECLLQGIAGPDVDESLYQHIHLEELVRLRLKAFENEMVNANRILFHHQDDEQQPFVEAKVPSPALMKEGTEVLGSIGKLEREMRILRSRNKRLQGRTEELESELENAMAAMDDVRALKEKTAELAGRQRNEKGLRAKSEFAAKQYGEQVVALTEHIEKLMIHLKHEAAAKARAVEAQKRTEKEVGTLRSRVATLAAKSKGKDKTISELRDGCKILEDQLRLLDEKQIDLRSKLDWTRNSAQKEVKRLQDDAMMLRTKWHMAIDSGMVKDFDVGPIMKQMKKNRKSIQPLPGAGANTHPQTNEAASSVDSFEIPSLPQKPHEKNTPWSDEKLSSLQQQQQEEMRITRAVH